MTKSVDFRHVDAKTRYKLLVGSVVPRPIALVTSCDSAGRVNAAPFSFFNAMCNDPPAVAVGVNYDPELRIKDTAANIAETEEFCVNLVDEGLAPLMNICEVEFPRGVSEAEMAGLNLEPGDSTAAPIIAEAPIAMECRLIQTVTLKPGRNIIIGEVLCMHFRDDLLDGEHHYVLAEKAGLIARMHGGGTYARTTDLFEMPRLTPEEKKARFDVKARARQDMGPGIGRK
ncbi:flavin reductase family protein [Oricola sp.]|uniref:flavin reductase family protein n=1 Tax=Oricola sp. TaxID=1979950 RepID=UPI003BAD0757